MLKNPLHLRLTLDHDQRLAAAAGGAMRIFADAAGLPDTNIEQLKVAVLSACKLCFRRLDDRIEVEVTTPGAPPPDKPHPVWPGVDDILCETRNDAGVLRLTKFLSPAS